MNLESKKVSKSMLSKPYLKGKEIWDANGPIPNPNPNSPHNKTLLEIAALNKNNKNDNFENYEEIVFNDNITEIMEMDFNDLDNNDSFLRSRVEWVHGWSLYNDPGGSVHMPIYFDPKYRQGFFTEDGDFYIPTNAYGTFGNHPITRSFDGYIVPENRIHYHSRPNRFTGLVYGPPYSPMTHPDIPVTFATRIKLVVKPIVKPIAKVSKKILNFFKK